MSISTISTFLHGAQVDSGVLGSAMELARVWDAHLHVVCAGIDATDPGFYYAGAQALAVLHNLDDARLDMRKLEEAAKERLEPSDLLWDLDAVTMRSTGVTPFLSNDMRFSDLAVLPMPYAKGRNSLDIAAFEACLFGADIPVLVIPEGYQMTGKPRRILLAWDDGMEALAAARAAMPLISAAKMTEICVIDPSPHSPDRSDPGGRLAQVLARGGAKVEITVSAKLLPETALQLLKRAKETGADMLVMGGYGHSRLREAVLGGVTRTVLHDAELPVLMAR